MYVCVCVCAKILKLETINLASWMPWKLELQPLPLPTKIVNFHQGEEKKQGRAEVKTRKKFPFLSSYILSFPNSSMRPFGFPSPFRTFEFCSLKISLTRFPSLCPFGFPSPFLYFGFLPSSAIDPVGDRKIIGLWECCLDPFLMQTSSDTCCYVSAKKSHLQNIPVRKYFADRQAYKETDIQTIRHTQIHLTILAAFKKFKFHLVWLKYFHKIPTNN